MLPEVLYLMYSLRVSRIITTLLVFASLHNISANQYILLYNFERISLNISDAE